MKIAIVGCLHGMLDKIYETIQKHDEEYGQKSKLLLCCGDFQSVRCESDLASMAVSDSKRHMRDFYKYYHREKDAPILTIFIGGNHEASAFLNKIPFGGWVAKNIFYMGRCGVINILKNGRRLFRLGGFSGIYKYYNYRKGIFEQEPFDKSTIRSIYHTRLFEVNLMKQLEKPIDIFLTHDWPNKVVLYGDVESLKRRHPKFINEIETLRLGNPGTQILLDHLQPDYWFAAHLHTYYNCDYKHSNGKKTQFTALSEVDYNEKFLEFIDFKPDFCETEDSENDEVTICYDYEWLATLKINYDKIPYNSINYVESPLKKPVPEDIEKLGNLPEKWPYSSGIYNDPTLQHFQFLNILNLSELNEEIEIF